VTLQLNSKPNVTYHTHHEEEHWTVTMVDTGQETQTGGRLRRVLPYIEDNTFLLTYGDGVTSSNINESIAFHQRMGGVATVTAVRPAARFGDLVVDNHRVLAFKEKPKDTNQFISGGFFVLNKNIGNYLTDDSSVLEQAPLTKLAAEGQVNAFEHTGFWQCMDTYREQQILEQLYASGKAPWKVW